VLIARKPILEVDYQMIIKGLQTLLVQAGIMKDVTD
jgi:hypothetical protein